MTPGRLRDEINHFANALVLSVTEEGIPESYAYLAVREKLGWDMDSFRQALGILVLGGLFRLSGDQIFPGPKFAQVKSAILAHGVIS